VILDHLAEHVLEVVHAAPACPRSGSATQTEARSNADGRTGQAGTASNGVASDALAARPEVGVGKRRLT